MEFHKRLRRLRKHAGLTQLALAAETGINQITLSRLETGARQPTREQLLTLARFFHLSLDDLYGGVQLADRPPSLPSCVLTGCPYADIMAGVFRDVADRLDGLITSPPQEEQG